MTRGQYTDAPTCYYCGEVACDNEHVIPRSFLKHLRGLGDPDLLKEIGFYSNRLKEVPSCRECNLLLGSKCFDTVVERKAFLHKRLRERYKRLLEMPNWSNSEIAELRGMLQLFIITSQIERERLLKRLSAAPRQAPSLRSKHTARNGRLGRPRRVDPEETAAVAEFLESIIEPGTTLLHTRRMGWMLRQWDSWESPVSGPRDGWREIESAPDGQLGAMLVRYLTAAGPRVRTELRQHSDRPS